MSEINLMRRVVTSGKKYVTLNLTCDKHINTSALTKHQISSHVLKSIVFKHEIFHSFHSLIQFNFNIKNVHKYQDISKRTK